MTLKRSYLLAVLVLTGVCLLAMATLGMMVWYNYDGRTTGSDVSGEDDLAPKGNEPAMTVPIIVHRSGGQNSLTEEMSNKSYITENSVFIIEGTVENVTSDWNSDNTSIFTNSTINISKYVKGAPSSNDTLYVMTEGGVVGNIGMSVEDAPTFIEGQKVRIYIGESHGEYFVFPGPNGVEEIE